MQFAIIPISLFVACVLALAVGLLIAGNIFSPRRRNRVKEMPYESGMDPIHEARRRFDIRFHLLAIAFLVFDVELLFLYPWAVAVNPAKVPEAAAVAVPAEGIQVAGLQAAVDQGPTMGYVDSRGLIFAGVMVFIALLTLGFIYDWRKGIFNWR